MILVTFAVPFESAAFRAKVHLNSEVECLHTGVGHAAAREALRKAFNQRPYSRVVISGFAGGLSQSLRVGDLVTPDHSQSATCKTDICSVKLLQSDTVLESPESKAAFRAATGADAVDMETRTIIEFCQGIGIPFDVIRAISDDARGSLVVPGKILTDVTKRPIRGIVQLLSFLLVRPKAWKPFREMVRNCRTAQGRLAEALIREVGR